MPSGLQQLLVQTYPTHACAVARVVGVRRVLVTGAHSSIRWGSAFPTTSCRTDIHVHGMRHNVALGKPALSSTLKKRRNPRLIGMGSASPERCVKRSEE